MPAGNPGGYKKFGDPKSGVKKMAKGKKGKKLPPWLMMNDEGKAAPKKKMAAKKRPAAKKAKAKAKK